MQKWSLGIDIGGTKIAIAQVNAYGDVQERLQIPTNVQGGPKAIEKDIVNAIVQLQRRVGKSPVGCGIGLAGQIDPENGIIHFAPNLKWHHVPLQQNLQNSLKLPVKIMNDVRAGTLGEWQYGAGKGCNDLVCLFIGTGIGGGIVSGGHLLVGDKNSAGELGHITIDLNGRLCTCGNHGCLESIAGGWAIAQRAQEKAAHDPKAGSHLVSLAGGIPSQITAKVVAQAAQEGDQLARQIVEETMEALVAGAASIANAFNPRRMIFGGGILNGLPEIIPRVRHGISKRALKTACQSIEIVPSSLGGDSVLIGAASVFL